MGGWQLLIFLYLCHRFKDASVAQLDRATAF